MLSTLLTIFGLVAFESVSSIDNAVINAEVLRGVSPKAKKWFLRWGLLFAVVGVRGLLPWLLVWAVAPALGPLGALTATFSGDHVAAESLEHALPLLLAGGGTFLLFLFVHWLFVEPKTYGLPHEPIAHQQRAWFYTIVSVLLLGLLWGFRVQGESLALAIATGSCLFFITHGFRETAEQLEEDLQSEHSKRSDWSKIFYLEMIDTVFSIDGVVGSFAFTQNIPLILIGNGLGALVVRQITVSGAGTIAQYPLLKNGAMYAILFLAMSMLAEAAGIHIPVWVAPLATIICIVPALVRKGQKSVD